MYMTKMEKLCCAILVQCELGCNFDNESTCGDEKWEWPFTEGADKATARLLATCTLASCQPRVHRILNVRCFQLL